MEATQTPNLEQMIEATREHRWLQRLVGDWKMEEADNESADWIEKIRPVGEIWIIAEGRGAMPHGGEGVTVMQLGYDPQQGRFVGSFLGTMMTNLWVYDGALDAEKNVLTLETSGPDFEGGNEIVPYKDIIELKGDDQRSLTSLVRQKDGGWKQIMAASYRRLK